jgi:Flp pilus assembly protein TadG
MHTMIRRFMRRDDGSATIEFVLWLPVYILIIGIITDATCLFVGQTQMWSIASNASRLVALRKLNEVGAEKYVTDHSVEGLTYTADVVINASTVRTTIRRKFNDVPGIGIISGANPVFGSSKELFVAAVYRLEPNT